MGGAPLQGTPLQIRAQFVATQAAKCLEDETNIQLAPAVRAMLLGTIYVWAPNALRNFDRFYADPENWARFKAEFFRGEALRYDERYLGNVMHFFPAPGRLYGEDLIPPERHSRHEAKVFRPTTRWIAINPWWANGRHYIPGIIETVHADKAQLTVKKGHLYSPPIREFPPVKGGELGRLAGTDELRVPIEEDGLITHEKPLTWLAGCYQLRMFLDEPFVGFLHNHYTGRRRPDSGFTHPPPEVVEVIMRAPPPRAKQFIFSALCQPAHRPLEYEIDVRGHMRRCASGKVVPVRPYKRGPRGVRRDKVVKVIR